MPKGIQEKNNSWELNVFPSRQMALLIAAFIVGWHLIPGLNSNKLSCIFGTSVSSFVQICPNLSPFHFTNMRSTEDWPLFRPSSSMQSVKLQWKRSAYCTGRAIPSIPSDRNEKRQETTQLRFEFAFQLWGGRWNWWRRSTWLLLSLCFRFTFGKWVGVQAQKKITCQPQLLGNVKLSPCFLDIVYFNSFWTAFWLSSQTFQNLQVFSRKKRSSSAAQATIPCKAGELVDRWLCEADQAAFEAFHVLE